MAQKWVDLPDDAPLDGEQLAPPADMRRPGQAPAPAQAAPPPAATPGWADLPDDVKLDEPPPPTIQSQVGGPPIVIVGKRNPRLDNPRYTAQGFQSGGVSPDAEYHSTLSDADKKEYETYFTDPKKPPTVAFLKGWLKDKTGADFANADKVVKQFKNTGKFSTDQTIITPTKDQSASQTAAEHYTAGAIPFAPELLGGPLSTLGLTGDPNRPNIWNSDLPLTQLWAQNADIDHAQLERDSNAHPAAALLGQMAGMASTAPLLEGAGDAAGLARIGEKFGEVPRQLLGQTAIGAVQGSSAGGPGHRLAGALEGAATVPAIAGVTALPFAAVNLGRSVLRGRPDLAEKIIAKAIKQDKMTPEQVAQTIAEAHANQVPMMMADVGPNLRGLLSAAARKPGEGRTTALDALEARQTGGAGPAHALDEVDQAQKSMADRLFGHIERDLGPIANPHRIADELMTKAETDSAPLYQAFHSQEPVGDPVIDSLLKRPPLQEALPEARKIAATDDVNPEALGLRLDENGNVVLEPGPAVSQEEVAGTGEGRWQNVEAPDPKEELTVRRYTAPNGRTVSVRGPLDVTQQLRLWGGLKDPVVEAQKRLGKGFKKFTNRGDFKHIGLGGKPRQLEFGGNEQMIGKLVNNKDGMDLDTAAQRISEAGYFPDRKEPLTPNDLLEILRDEDHGRRYFHPDDAEEVARFNDAQNNKNYLRQLEDEGAPASEDLSGPAGEGPPQAPPAPGREPTKGMEYRPQTLDYVKRGLDDVLEKFRDKTTGKLVLNTYGREVANTLRQFRDRVDQLFPQWKPARDAWGGPVAGVKAMNLGRKALTMQADDLAEHLKDMTTFERKMFKLGARRAMFEKIDAAGDTANIVKDVLGSGKKRRMMRELFKDDPNYARFEKTLHQEQEGWRTYARAKLGSSTAVNLADDETLQMMLTAAETIASGGKIPAVRLALKYGFSKAAQKAHNQIAGFLTDVDPATAARLAENLRARAIKRGLQVRRQATARTVIGTQGIPATAGRQRVGEEQPQP